ncbi:MAG: GTP pyrophosphokinase family protein [Eubacterium sp.]|nr:GTP pyrophosphokinase family protein [Eubacterium sp.]
MNSINTNSIYGEYAEYLDLVLEDLSKRFKNFDDYVLEQTGEHGFEHIITRIKSDESMREKCIRKGIPETPYSALYINTDAIGMRIVTSFVDDIYLMIKYIKSFDNCEVIEEKDYIKHAKPNGYRSYHLILAVTTDYPDVNGNEKGIYYVEIQIRTIAMDTWASLEHKIRYKKNIAEQELISNELKRCADELASCELSMQTIRGMIRSKLSQNENNDESGNAENKENTVI